MAENTSQELIENLLQARLDTLDLQVEQTGEVDLNEVLRIKDALDADRPTADMVMQVVFNAFDFLHRTYELESDDDFKAILAFLETFYGHVKTGMMEKASTLKEGLKMERDA